MDKQPENEANNAVNAAAPASEVLSEKELDQVSGGDEAPKETVTFEYGGLVIRYAQQSPNGLKNP